MSARAADPFAKLTLCHMLVDWSDPKWDRDMLSNLFMSYPYHWDAHDWARSKDNQFGPADQKMHPVEIERQILAEVHPKDWHGVSKYGKPFFQHFLILCKLMFPKGDITDTLADTVNFFCTAMGCGKKILNLIGSQNSSKTAAACRIAYVTMFINPEYTKWTISNPFDNVADSGVWGEIEILWDDLGIAWPGGNHTLLFPNAVVYANRRIEFIPNRPRVAHMELKNIKHTGKGKGAKSRKDALNEDQGVFGEIVDEINEIDNPAFLTRVYNSFSQDNYFCITGQNFKDVADMGGQITEPFPAYEGCPDSFEKLNVDDDLWWHSVKSGITLRFDGHNAANIKAGRTIYPYLFKEENRKIIAEGGVQSPVYMSQVRSFPVQGASANSLLSRPKLSASRHEDPFFSIIGQSTSVAFCDPAFGGRDNAVYGSALFAMCRVTDGAGMEQNQELLIFPDVFSTIQLVREARWPGDNNYWLERYRAVGLDPADETHGALISFEDQIALKCREFNRMRSVPAANFGYDFSMRPDIVTSMNKIIGFGSLAFSYPHPPTGLPLVNFKGRASKEGADDSKDLCKNKLTEMGMFIADVFLSKALRGGEKIPTAIMQLCRTQLELHNKKYVIEDKAAYKARFNGVSPDHRDVLVGIGAVAAMRGFRASLKAAHRETGSRGTFALLRKHSKFKSPSVARLPARS